VRLRALAGAPDDFDQPLEEAQRWNDADWRDWMAA